MSKTSAIRVTVSRHLSESEKEWVRSIFRVQDQSVAMTNWDGLTYKWTQYPFHVRLSKRGKFWVHSDTVEARRLYHLFLRFLENNFVNVHPTAVRTFSSIPSTKDGGWMIDDVFAEEAQRRGWISPENVTDLMDEIDCPDTSQCDIHGHGDVWEVVGLVDA